MNLLYTLSLADVASTSASVEGWWVGLVGTAASLALLGAAWVFAQLQRKLGADAGATKAQLVAARIAHFAEVVVQGQQPAVDALKRMASDGKLTRDEAAEVLSTALAQLKSVAGPAALDELQAVLKVAAPSVDVYLKGALESALARTRAPSIAPPAGVVIPPRP